VTFFEIVHRNFPVVIEENRDEFQSE